MRALMERLARAPPGYGVWAQAAAGSHGNGGGSSEEGGPAAATALDWEPWPQEDDTSYTAWHKVCLGGVGGVCVGLQARRPLAFCSRPPPSLLLSPPSLLLSPARTRNPLARVSRRRTRHAIRWCTTCTRPRTPRTATTRATLPPLTPKLTSKRCAPASPTTRRRRASFPPNRLPSKSSR